MIMPSTLHVLARAGRGTLTHEGLQVTANHPVLRSSLSIPDTLFLFVVALVVFGPKRLPEIGKQIGKLVFEFRRASNDFKLQIEEELRMSEQQEKQKQIAMQAAPVTPAVDLIAASQPADGVSTALPGTAEPASSEPLVVQPPSTGELVSARPPNRTAPYEADTYGADASSGTMRDALTRGAEAAEADTVSEGARADLHSSPDVETTPVNHG